MIINKTIKPADLKPQLNRLWEASAKKILSIDRDYDLAMGSPVFTIKGQYTSRGWTEWTQGFLYGSFLLQYDATEDSDFLQIGRNATLEKMTSHIGHFGVHDHGFNNISTYGNLLRLMAEGKIPFNEWESQFYKLALKLSGAVQARRWTPIPNGGYIYSFNGPHSLFVDTIRSLRSLVVSHELDYGLWGEHDEKISLLSRAIQHAVTTAKFSVYYGEERDAYDVWGRTAHESIFNINDGNYRCPGSQQGYSGFTTWTRGLAWAMTGFAEQLEYLSTIPKLALDLDGDFDSLEQIYRKATMATCDFYISNTPVDGIPYWDTGAPNLDRIGDYLNVPADPFNHFEPVDSSAAAIGAQGLLRLGRYLESKNDDKWKHYWQAGLTVAKNLFDEPYLNDSDQHQGLILHSVYHYPRGWDYIPPPSKIPHSESSMWGDYHARELALYLWKIVNNESYYTFFNGIK